MSIQNSSRTAAALTLGPLQWSRVAGAWRWTAELTFAGGGEWVHFPGPKLRALQLHHEFQLRLFRLREHPRAVLKWLDSMRSKPWAAGPGRRANFVDLVRAHPGAKPQPTDNDYMVLRIFVLVVSAVLHARGQLAKPIDLPFRPPFDLAICDALRGADPGILNEAGFVREYQDLYFHGAPADTPERDAALRGSAERVRVARRMYHERALPFYRGAELFVVVPDAFMTAPLEEPLLPVTLPARPILLPLLHAGVSELAELDEGAFTCGYLTLQWAFMREESLNACLLQDAAGVWSLHSQAAWGDRALKPPGWMIRRHLAMEGDSFFLGTPTQREAAWTSAIKYYRSRDGLADCDPMHVLRTVALDYVHARYSPSLRASYLGFPPGHRVRISPRGEVEPGFFALWADGVFSDEPALRCHVAHA